MISTEYGNILVIEDNPGDARLLEEYLKDTDSRIIKAETLAQGKKIVLNEDIGLIILDLELPDSQGNKTVNNIKLLSSDVPIIVLTGLRDERMALTSIRFGAQDYLVKSEINAENINKSIKYAVERFRLFNSVSRLSRTDELTGLSNRRGFYALAAKQYQFAARNNLFTHIVYIDIDNLKLINDAFGHDTGDAVIKDTALFLKNVFREWDVIARMGGDEFAVLVITGKSENLETAVISRIREQVSEYNKRGNPYCLSLSFGISKLYDFSREALKDALKAADSLMYDDKKIKKINGNISF